MAVQAVQWLKVGWQVVHPGVLRKYPEAHDEQVEASQSWHPGNLSLQDLQVISKKYPLAHKVHAAELH